MHELKLSKYSMCAKDMETLGFYAYIPYIGGVLCVPKKSPCFSNSEKYIAEAVKRWNAYERHINDIAELVEEIESLRDAADSSPAVHWVVDRWDRDWETHRTPPI